jgi:hypothetical protein
MVGDRPYGREGQSPFPKPAHPAPQRNLPPPRPPPSTSKFARITQQEEAAGLLADPATIARLAENGFALGGHHLIKAVPGEG